MCVFGLLMNVNLMACFITASLSALQVRSINESLPQLAQVWHLKTLSVPGELVSLAENGIKTSKNQIPTPRSTNDNKRPRSDSSIRNNTIPLEGSFQIMEVGCSIINEEVDMVIPMVLAHLQLMNIQHLQLPNIKESVTITPLFINYEAGLFLSNGIVYNTAGIKRLGIANMTYVDKSFLCRFYLILKSSQFEYDFLIKLRPVEGYGRVKGSLEDTIIFAELTINVSNSILLLHDFRIISFRNILVQLDQKRIIGTLTGLILSPISNLFKDRITTSISDSLKDQMRTLLNDFNDKDLLELRKFTKKLLASLTGIKKSSK